MLQALSFEQPVPRRYVHRKSVSEVYLTDSAPAGEDDRFFVGAQWPRLHGYYHSDAGRYDTLLLAETVRQCAIYLAHRHYRVPFDRKFTMERLHVDSHLDHLHIGPHAADVTLDARVAVHARKHGRISAFTLTVDFHMDGRHVGAGSTVANILNADEYQRARWRGDRAPFVGQVPLPPPIPPGSVGIADHRAVTLSAHPSGSDDRWILRTDLDHPVLFDHPSDHVPGAVLLEAVRQSARLSLGIPCADIESVEIGFRQFLELDEPTSVTATLATGQDVTVDVEFAQWGVVKAHGSVRLEPHRSARRAHTSAGTHRA